MRSSFAQASECSEKVLQPDFDTWASRCASSCTLSGKLTQPRSWRLAWKKEAWMQRLYGSAICEPCPTGDFVAWWTQSLQASRAKTSPLPARAQGSTAAAPGSSSTSSMPPTLAVRGSSLWRTSQASLLPPPPLWTRPKALSKSERPPESWENWPTAGGMRNGSLFQRPTLVLPTGGNGGSASHGEPPSAWPTAKGSDGKNGGPNQAGSKGDLMLPSAAAQWGLPASSRMTPDVPNGGRKLDAETIARKGIREDGTKAQVGLENQTRMWMTPGSGDDRGPSIGWEAAAERHAANGQHKQMMLRDQSTRWMTPHGMAGIDKNGKAGAGGEFAKQSPAWQAPWPTPTSTNGGANSNRDERGNVGADLREASQNWPTPRATTRAGDSGSAQRHEQGPNPGLYDMAREWTAPVSAWPTPASRDYRSPNAESYEDRGGGTKGEQLQNFVAHRFSSPPAQPIPDGPESSPPTRTSPLRLNPLFAAWLMGWPSTWTIAAPHASSALETESFRFRLRSALSSLLGAPGSSET
jgi:hypothetical protein